jgi:hypothetical protein
MDLLVGFVRPGGRFFPAESLERAHIPSSRVPWTGWGSFPIGHVRVARFVPVLPQAFPPHLERPLKFARIRSKSPARIHLPILSAHALAEDDPDDDPECQLP